ncbi:hypothetical protein H6P81_014333 [Aristolochia fimbriata]|uniref:Uncharacterized protein n=1 Tax=Aristolochia fimbriata TaxID=158543 RepID=A0AAV7EH84_ARIFI|nr:hypothetical protein H6P81_014333 [Aristolochia fimbriata]
MPGLAFSVFPAYPGQDSLFQRYKRAERLPSFTVKTEASTIITGEKDDDDDEEDDKKCSALGMPVQFSFGRAAQELSLLSSAKGELPCHSSAPFVYIQD